METTLSHCFVLVDDQDKALGVYRDVLGLEVRNDATMGPIRWLTVGPPAQPGVEIGLLAVNYDPNASAEDRQTLAALVTKGVLPGLIFNTADCDGTFERIRSAGAEVLQEPIDQPYGARDCAFRDPAGNMVRFAQRG